MKDQYFGDINDYRKYALLLELSGSGDICTGVCWMLTGADHGFEAGGRLYCTTLAAMTLEIYYRYMPIYTKKSSEDDFMD